MSSASTNPASHVRGRSAQILFATMVGFFIGFGAPIL